MSLVSNKLIRQAIYEKLNVASLTTLLASGSAGIVHAVAPPSAAYPLCVFQKQAGLVDQLAMGGDAAKNQLWVVKGVVRGTSQSVAEDIDKATTDLLHFGSLNISGADDMYLAREGDVEYPEVSGDAQFRHVGGIYRLIVQDA